MRYNFIQELDLRKAISRKASAWTGSNVRLTRMRVLHCEVELTGKTGKIERSADALQVISNLSFPKTQNPFPEEIFNLPIFIFDQQED